MSRGDILKRRQARLREDITGMLDSFLKGDVVEIMHFTIWRYFDRREACLAKPD